MRGKGHTGKRAWASREAAEAECVRRFGAVGWLTVEHYCSSLLRQSLKHSAVLDRAARGAHDLDRAAKLLRRAADRATPLRQMPEWELLDAPESVLTLSALVAEVEAARDFLSTVPRSTTKWSRSYLVRSVAERGIRARASDWCLAFIALGLPPGPAADSMDFAGRVSMFARDAKVARLPLLRVR